jgi:alpha-galactosidase
LYAILDRVNKKYPDLPMMLCSGGGGRSDYEALRYFTEFWPSDNTDAIERIFIQWGFGYFFPSKSLSAHVTSWGKQPLKFRTDVAMMGKLGFDLRVADLSEAERAFCRSAVQNYNRLKPVILDGSMYRLYPPYAGEHAAVLYADTTRLHAVVFAFDMHPRYGDREYPLHLRGLDPALRYEVSEINLFPGTKTRLRCDGKTYSGEYLMKVGIPVFSSSKTTSHVIELNVVE